MPGDLVIQTVEHDKDDVVWHRGWDSAKQEYRKLRLNSIHCGSELARDGGLNFNSDVD
jgi:hypothetical protein